MTTLNYDKFSTLNQAVNESELLPPNWVMSLTGQKHQTLIVDDLVLTIRTADRFSLISARFHDAIRASSSALETHTIAIYQLLRKTLDKSPHPHPIRLWNFLPAIHEPFESGLDRYKVFNSGRHKAFCQWWETAEALLNQVPTASGVGHCGADLVIHCLATDQPGVGIENPRQIPSLGYSRRYGPRPPCFARATLHGKRLLVGGTASILGEESTHPDDLESQFRETLTNVAAVASRAIVRLGKANASVGQLNEEKILSLFSSLRIYHPKRRDQKWIQRETQPRFPGLTEIEYLRADLCRPELLVEIEGVADLS